jgi:hypothetical protein
MIRYPGCVTEMGLLFLINPGHIIVAMFAKQCTLFTLLLV